MIANSNTHFHIRQSFACGNECANVGTITGKTEDGSVTRCELVMVYKVDDDGKVLSLRAFWEFDELINDIFKSISFKIIALKTLLLNREKRIMDSIEIDTQAKNELQGSFNLMLEKLAKAREAIDDPCAKTTTGHG